MKFVFRLDNETNINNFKDYFIGYSAGPDSTACVVRLVQSLYNFHRGAKEKKWDKKDVTVTLVFCSSGIERHNRVEAQGEALCARLSKETGIELRMHVKRVDSSLWKEADWSLSIRSELEQIKNTSPDPLTLKGHQLDEQVETFVMWSLRGKKNIMKIWDKENLVARPLLLARKSEIYEFLDKKGFSSFVVEDPTNHIQESNQRAYYRVNMAHHIEHLNPGIYRMVREDTAKRHRADHFLLDSAQGIE
jgi:tRNA(Ile)-lysidine synthase TilS/MesJ